MLYNSFQDWFAVIHKFHGNYQQLTDSVFVLYENSLQEELNPHIVSKNSLNFYCLGFVSDVLELNIWSMKLWRIAYIAILLTFALILTTF